MFSDSSSTCGSMCDSKKSKQRRVNKEGSNVKKSGWTPFYMSADNPDNTGDHEHYSYYLTEQNKKLIVYGSDGQAYENCIKKAIHVRERLTHIPWWTLAINYTILFSDVEKTFYNKGEHTAVETTKYQTDDVTYQTTLKPNYG